MNEDSAHQTDAPTPPEVGSKATTPMRERTGTDDTSVGRSPHGTTMKALRTRPGRHVFVEDGNTEAWIATGNAVVPSP